MANQKHDEIKQEISLLMSELIAGLIQETIDADQAVTADYLQEIKAYAFDDPDGAHPKLKTVSFEMTDDEGRRRQVTVPVLSLLPLPVLHISEATFDIDTQVTYVEEIFEKDKLPQSIKLRKPSTGKMIRQNFKDRITETPDGKFKITKFKLLAPAGTASTPSDPTSGASQAPSAGPNNDNTIQQTFNAKIHVKLEQSVLPSGMRGLLQETDRSITTEYI